MTQTFREHSPETCYHRVFVYFYLYLCISPSALAGGTVAWQPVSVTNFALNCIPPKSPADQVFTELSASDVASGIVKYNGLTSNLSNHQKLSESFFSADPLRFHILQKF